MTRNEWLEKLDYRRAEVRAFVGDWLGDWHPGQDPNPLAQFDSAVQAGNIGDLAGLIREAWVKTPAEYQSPIDSGFKAAGELLDAFNSLEEETKRGQ